MSTQQLKLAQEEEPEFNGDKMDNILNPDGLDWSFDKPTEGDYHTIYIIKKVEEEEDPYFCEDCGKDFKWKSGTSSAGASVNDYHCGSCVEEEGYEEWSRRTGKDKEWTSLEKEFYNKEEEEYCDDCEGPCRADETEECEDCKIKLRIGCANNPSNHSIFDGCCDDCREEEEEEEELDICGETGREFDEGNPLKGCGKKITEDDENLMIGNISYCLSCVENSEEEVISEWHEAQGR